MTSQATIDNLIKNLNNENSEIREETAFEMAKISPEDAANVVESLLEHLTDKDSDVQRMIICSLGKTKSKKAIDYLVEYLKDNKFETRWVTAEALGEIGSEKAIPYLLECLNKESVGNVRASVIKSLAKIGVKSVIPSLLNSYLNDENPFVREEASYAIKQLTSDLKIVSPVVKVPINLSNWFQEVFEAGFQALSTLINQDTQLDFYLMSSSSEKPVNEPVSGGKIIDLGITINNTKVALIIKIYPDEEDKRQIQVQLLPSGDEFLPPNIKLVMLTTAGKVLQEIEARSQDNYIQLLPFKNQIGKSFILQLKLDEEVLSEEIFVI